MPQTSLVALGLIMGDCECAVAIGLWSGTKRNCQKSAYLIGTICTKSLMRGVGVLFPKRWVADAYSYERNVFGLVCVCCAQCCVVARVADHEGWPAAYNV